MGQTAQADCTEYLCNYSVSQTPKRCPARSPQAPLLGLVVSVPINANREIHLVDTKEATRSFDRRWSFHANSSYSTAPGVWGSAIKKHGVSKLLNRSFSSIFSLGFFSISNAVEHASSTPERLVNSCSKLEISNYFYILMHSIFFSKIFSLNTLRFQIVDLFQR